MTSKVTHYGRVFIEMAPNNRLERSGSKPRAELAELTADGFEAVMPPRERIIERSAPEIGSWAQWEAIWRRR